MKLIGFVASRKVVVAPVTISAAVCQYKTFACGGGEWSLELWDKEDSCIQEFVGNNGTKNVWNPSGESDDLWEEASEWLQLHGEEIYKEGYSFREYEAPDGFWRSYSWFLKEARKGNLHGLIAIL